MSGILIGDRSETVELVQQHILTKRFLYMLWNAKHIGSITDDCDLAKYFA